MAVRLARPVRQRVLSPIGDGAPRDVHLPVRPIVTNSVKGESTMGRHLQRLYTHQPRSCFATLTASLLTGVLGLIGLGVPWADAAPTRRFQTDDRGNFVVIGNTVGQDCRSGVPQPVVGNVSFLTCGILGLGDSGIDAYWRSDSPTNGQAQAGISITSGVARSSAVLGLPAGASVTYARLYWSTQRAVAINNESALLERPGSFSRAVSAQAADIKSVSLGGLNYYQASVDVTAIVRSLGNGAYRIGGFNSDELGNLLNDITYSGWNLTVFYKLDSEPVRRLSLYDGFDLLSNSKVNATLSGLLVPSTGAEGRLGVIAYEGDADIKGDALRVNGTAIADGQNPVDNFFNSTRSRLGSAVTVAGDLPQLTGGPASMSGVDLDIIDITGNLKAGDTQLSVEAQTSGDEVFLGGLLSSITSVRPVLSGSSKTYVNLSRSDGRALPGDLIEYTLTVANNGSDGAVNVTVTDPLPTQVSFVPGSLRVTGPNAGNKTDSTGDDQAEYVAGTRTVVGRLGSGANGVQGGSLATSDGPASLIFRVMVNAGAMGQVANQGIISGQGQTATAQGNPEASTWPTGNGSSPGAPTVFQISTCATSMDCPVTAPVCDTTASPPQCVCRMDADCPSGTICNAVTRTCAQCSLTNTTNCQPGTNGGVCLPSGVCGCTTNSDCGGRACDPVTKTCPPIGTDLSVSLSRQPTGASLAPGSAVTYSVGVKNNSSIAIIGGTLSDTFRPTPQGPVQWTCVASGGAVCPASSGSGALPTSLTLPAGAMLAYTVKTSLPTAQMSMSVDYTVTAATPPGFADTNPADNIASDSVLLAPVGPDLVVTVTESKSPTDPAVTYTVQVHNNGPGTADGATVAYDIPAGATLQDVTAGAGWTCSSTAQRVTCTRTAPIKANEDASPIVIKVLPPAGATSIPVDISVDGTDSQGNPVTDPDPSSNTIHRSTELQSLNISGGGFAFGCNQSGSHGRTTAPDALGILAFTVGGVSLLRARRRLRVRGS